MVQDFDIGCGWGLSGLASGLRDFENLKIILKVACTFDEAAKFTFRPASPEMHMIWGISAGDDGWVLKSFRLKVQEA